MIAFGASDITKAYIGSTEVSKAYLGNDLVWGGESPVLPYDAELEFLQSSGTQYIDTGIKITKGDVITLTFQTVGTQSTAFMGCRTSGTSGKCVIGSGTSSTIIYAALGSSSNTKLINYDQGKHTVVLNTETGRASIDGGTSKNVGTYTANNLNALLFACNQGGTPSLHSSIKIFSLEISGKASFIPVRVGTTGYMYDTVSGELFGNDGSGSFTLGNDVD